MSLLKGKHVLLRALEQTDLDLLYEWENDTTIWMVSGTQAPFSKFVLEQYLNSAHQDIYTHKQMRLVIEFIEDAEEESGYPVGCIDLFDFDPKNMHAGLGILIGDKDMMNRGFASEALELMIKYCFGTLNLHQIYCNVTTENETSLHLFKKFGFEVTGLKQDWVYHDGKYHDEYLLQLINR